MRLLSSFELRILVLFVFTSMVFSSFLSSNDESRVFLARAMVDEGSLSIDPYFNATVDRAVFNNSYYIDKFPGSSFFAAPIYFFSSRLFGKPDIHSSIDEQIIDFQSYALYF